MRGSEWMADQRLARTALVALLCCAFPSSAEKRSTSDMVTFLGGRSAVVLDRRNLSTIDREPRYINFGLVAWIARSTAQLPVPVTITSRGFPGVLFFEVAPLLDLIER